MSILEIIIVGCRYLRLRDMSTKQGVRLLLENGADVNSKDDDDWIETDEWYDSDTPLSFATKYRDEAMVGLLLEKGGDADSKIRWILHRCRWPRQKNMRTQLSK